MLLMTEKEDSSKKVKPGCTQEEREKAKEAIRRNQIE